MDSLLSVVQRNRTRSNGHKLEHRKLYLNMKKRFAVWFTEHWNRLAREAVESPVLETFKSHLDTNLSILLWGTLPEQAGRTRLPPMVPSNLTHCVILRKMPSLGRKVKVYNSFYKPPKAVFLS